MGLVCSGRTKPQRVMGVKKVLQEMQTEREGERKEETLSAFCEGATSLSKGFGKRFKKNNCGVYGIGQLLVFFVVPTATLFFVEFD